MRRSFVVPFVGALAVGCGSSSPSSGPADANTRAPLYENLGAFHIPITASSPDAQRYFDQGMRLSYAFNHAEAIRAFRQAAAIDPQCAMCYWGVAYALGPNINAPITPEAARDAWNAIGQARQARGEDLSARQIEAEEAPAEREMAEAEAAAMEPASS